MKKEFKKTAIEVVRLKKMDIIRTSTPLGSCTGTDSCGSADTCDPDM